MLPLPPALCCSCGGSSAPGPLAPPDGGVGIAPHLRCCARMRLTRLCAAVTLRLIAAGVATPTYDPAHPDQSPAPHSNAEFSSGTSATTPTGAGGVPLPWLKGLLTAEGQRLMWDGQTVHNSPGQSCRWGTYLCYNAPPVDGHGCTGQPVGSKAHNYPGAGAYAAGAPATGTEMCLHGYDMISNSISDWGGGAMAGLPPAAQALAQAVRGAHHRQILRNCGRAGYTTLADREARCRVPGSRHQYWLVPGGHAYAHGRTNHRVRASPGESFFA
eukprot:COSAG01_NODE_15916_length_1286_cov_0.924179_2_plen_272_part_00